MKIMAVVNVTPDSFHDGGHHSSTDAAVAFALKCVEEGADILDIGGESSRPGSEPVTLADELKRVIPVINGIRRTHSTIPISIDTTKSAVIREAGPYHIQYTNDISALRADPQMAEVLAHFGMSVILMHMQGSPKTMQRAPEYDDVVAEVIAFLGAQIAAAVSAGIPKNKILIDPGIGFGKTVEHNVALIQQLAAFSALNCPLVVGTSRKSFIGKLTDVTDPDARLPGSLATLPAMLRANVAIVRTHDVAATRQFLKVYQAL